MVLTYNEAVHIARRKKAADTETVIRLSLGHHSIASQTMIIHSLSEVSIGQVLYNEFRNSYIINLVSGPQEEVNMWPMSAVTSWILVRPEDMRPDTKLHNMLGTTLLTSLLAAINQPINTIKDMHSDPVVQTKLIAKMQEKLGTWEPYEGKTVTN